MKIAPLADVKTRLTLAHSPRFQALLDESHRSISADKGLSRGAFWKAVAEPPAKEELGWAIVSGVQWGDWITRCCDGQSESKVVDHGSSPGIRIAVRLNGTPQRSCLDDPRFEQCKRSSISPLSASTASRRSATIRSLSIASTFLSAPTTPESRRF